MRGTPYDVRACDLVDHILLVCPRVDGTISADGVDLLTLAANLRHGVVFCALELVDQVLDNIDKDNLDTPVS